MRPAEMSVIRLCETSQVPAGEMLGIELDGLPPLAVFNVDGEFFVTSNICTHSVASLSDGYFEDTTIYCPLHGGAFDVRTGEATEFPCETALKTYPVIMKDEAIFIEMP